MNKLLSAVIRSVSIAAVALLSFEYFLQPAAATPGDFDGDGAADLSVGISYRPSSKNIGSSAWLTRLSNGDSPLFWSWSVPADAYAIGRFYPSDQRYYPAVIWVRDSRKPLEWYLKDAAGVSRLIKFGLPGDTITSLADWEGDGLDDLMVVRPGSGGILYWFIRLSSTGQTVLYVFGVKGDKVAAVDTDGDGMAEMVALRNGFTWFIRKPAELTFTQTQWGANGDLPLMPRDLDGDHLPDFIVARRTGSGQTALIRYGSGATASIALGSDTSIPQLGRFGPGSDFAWSQRDLGTTAIKAQDQSVNQFSFGIPSNAIIRPDGTVIQPNEDGRFGTVQETGSAACLRTYTSGWLFKPESQDSGGSREGKPLVLFSKNYPSTSCLNVISTNGQVIAHYGRYSSNRFYSGYGCGEGLTAPQIAQRATDASGSKNILLQDSKTGTCYGPAAADARTDRR